MDSPSDIENARSRSSTPEPNLSELANGPWPTEALWVWESEDHETYLRTRHKDEAAIRDLATQKLSDPLIPLFTKLKYRLLHVIHLDHSRGEKAFDQQKKDVEKTRKLIEQLESAPSPARHPRYSAMLGRAKKFLGFIATSTTNREKAMAEDREVTQEEIDGAKSEWRQSVKEAFVTRDRDRENDKLDEECFFLLDI